MPDFMTADQLAAKFNKELGPGAITMASGLAIPRRFTSGSLSLDVSIGGGFSGNQWTEIYGPENHGKTTVSLKTIATNQALDPNFFTLWVAAEAFDVENAEALGVDVNRVHILSTRDMAVGYQTVLEYLENRACDAAVIDSYPAMIPPQEDEKEMDEYTQAEGAKLTNKFFRKVGKAGLRDPQDPSDRPFIGLFINQPRQKIGGGMPGRPPPETTPGGMGKNFAFYTRLTVKRVEWIEVGSGENKSKVGQVIRTQAIKNKGGPPQRVASMDYYFTDAEVQGVPFRRGEYDVQKDVLTMSILFDVVRRGGAWYTFGDKQWQGAKAVLQAMREEPDLSAAIDSATREAADNPHDKRTWDEEQLESAVNQRTVVKKRRKKADDADQ